MRRQNIYGTVSVASVMSSRLIQDLQDFLVGNRAYILPRDKRNDAFKTKVFGQSLLSDVVHRLTILDKDQAYSLIKLPTKTVALREAIDMTFVPIDLLQIKDLANTSSKTLSLIPEIDDKLVINITDITKSGGDFSNITEFHYRVVRAFLSRSFYVSSGNVWLSPTLVRYVAKVYSMTMGARIARVFNLMPPAQSFVQTVFCAFFVGLMTSESDAVAFMKAHGRHMSLPDSSDLLQITAFMKDVLDKDVPLSIEDVCAVIDAYDHGQMKSPTGSRIDRPVINMAGKSIFPDGLVSVIALEYPPYFMFLILLALSNIPIGLSVNMKSMNLLKEGREVFEQLIRSHSLFNGL